MERPDGEFPDGAEVTRRLQDLDAATRLDQLRLIEAGAAATYWAALATLPVRFAQVDRSGVPDHWTVVGPRRSPITGTQRLAANPTHAILNYVYALLEAEARIGCATVGLDPAIGILHADQPYRDSLGHDIMEATRPDVDRYVLASSPGITSAEPTFTKHVVGRAVSTDGSPTPSPKPAPTGNRQ